jgi:hypothetical protein
MGTKDMKLFMKKNVTEIYTKYLENQMDSKSMKLIMEKRRYVIDIIFNIFFYEKETLTTLLLIHNIIQNT